MVSLDRIRNTADLRKERIGNRLFVFWMLDVFSFKGGAKVPLHHVFRLVNGAKPHGRILFDTFVRIFARAVRNMNDAHAHPRLYSNVDAAFGGFYSRRIRIKRHVHPLGIPLESFTCSSVSAVPLEATTFSIPAWCAAITSI